MGKGRGRKWLLPFLFTTSYLVVSVSVKNYNITTMMVIRKNSKKYLLLRFNLTIHS